MAITPKRIQKRPVLLLEIMIALALISLCILPLLMPRAEMLKEQNSLTGHMQLDHDVNLLYCDVLERLQKNEIPMRDILEHTVLPIDQTMLQRQGIAQLPLALTGSYRFDAAPKPNHKENKTSGWSTHRLLLTFAFVSPEQKETVKSRKYLFQYRLFLAHQGVPTTETEEKSSSSDSEKSEAEKDEEEEEPDED